MILGSRRSSEARPCNVQCGGVQIAMRRPQRSPDSETDGADPRRRLAPRLWQGRTDSRYGPRDSRMDGLVTRALAEVLRRRVDGATYAAIVDAAGVDGAACVPGATYPDTVTFDLVGAAARRLDVNEGAVLEMLGEHWVPFAIEAGYGRFLTTAGRTLRDVLLNLDRMHEKLSHIYPHLRQPTFWCTDIGDAGLVLHYASSRPGLAPLVMGIVRGLARMHHARVEIEHRRSRADGAPHDEFLVRLVG